MFVKGPAGSLRHSGSRPFAIQSPDNLSTSASVDGEMKKKWLPYKLMNSSLFLRKITLPGSAEAARPPTFRPLSIAAIQLTVG
jgi:hypothetical protein